MKEMIVSGLKEIDCGGMWEEEVGEKRGVVGVGGRGGGGGGGRRGAGAGGSWGE